MIYLISKYRQPEPIILSPCLSTKVTSKHFLLRPRIETNIECDYDSDYLQMLRQTFLKLFPKQVQNSGRNIPEPEKVEAAAKKYFKLSSAEMETEQKFLWRIPR